MRLPALIICASAPPAIVAAFLAMAVVPSDMATLLGMVLMCLGLFGAVLKTWCGHVTRFPMALLSGGCLVFFLAKWRANEAEKQRDCGGVGKLAVAGKA